MASQSPNIWNHKPAWCQPWSIILTGTVITIASWLILHVFWITLIVAVAIVAWWVYFLIIYPKAFAEYMLAQQNKLNTHS